MPSRPLTIVFCLPGNNFSGQFLECWSTLLAFCLEHNIRPVVSRKSSCNIYFVRNMCLGADVMRGKYQKPFNGEIDYDYTMWIDSDVLFTPQHFVNLLNHNQNIVSGVYLMEGGTHLATVKDWDEEFFKKNGYFQFLTPNDLTHFDAAQCRPDPSPTGEGKNNLIKVAYTGMGFMLVEKGVFESLEYPWFKPIEKQIGDMVDFTMEDVAFCLQAKERGYEIMIDPSVRVGHEKKMVL